MTDESLPAPVVELLTFFRDHLDGLGQVSLKSLPQHLHKWVSYCEGEKLIATNCGKCSLLGPGEWAIENSRDGGSDWPRQAEVAKRLYPSEKPANRKMKVQRLIGSGDLKTNGKTGNACRVDPASVLAFCKQEGLAYNET